MPPARTALLAADTDHTQQYVFESSRLPEIRGASRILDDLSDWAAEQISQAGGTIVLEGGGNLLALVPVEKAESLAVEVEEQFAEESQTATITVDWRPISEDQLNEQLPDENRVPFGSLIQWAGTWLRRKKDSRDLVPWSDTLSFSERCSSCQTRPAEARYLSVFPDRTICSVCYAKGAYVRRDYWFRQFQLFLSKESNAAKKYYRGESPFPEFYQERRRARWTPQDLNEIGQACGSRPGYIGMIYLDGDVMGEVFLSVDTLKNAQLLSQGIQDSSRRAVMESLADYLHPGWVQPSASRQGTDEQPDGSDLNQSGDFRIHPFEILTIGGDDILLIVPADQAIPIACTISQRFQETLPGILKSRGYQGKYTSEPLTLSGGVVLADDHNPVRAMRDQAVELKTSAKQARHKEGAKEGFVDFLVLLGTDMPDRDLKKSRKLFPYLIQQPGFPPVSLLARPYPASRLKEAWSHLQTLREVGFPNSQMTLLTESLLKGVQESRLMYLYQRQRGANFEYLDAALKALRSEGLRDNYPWFEFEKDKPSPLRAQTALWDIAELYSLVSAAG